MPAQYDERNEKLSIVSRRSISIRRNDRAKSRREENRCDTGCNELDGKLVEGGGRKSENEWRVVVRSDMCTWHASNACLPPRSLSLPPSMGHSCDPLPSSSPWPTSKYSARYFRTETLISRSIVGKIVLFVARKRYASGWQRVSLLLIVSFFSFFKARLCRIVPAHLATLET